MLGFKENSTSTFGNFGIFGNNSNATPFRGSFTFGNNISGNNKGTQIKFEVAFKFTKNIGKKRIFGRFHFFTPEGQNFDPESRLVAKGRSVRRKKLKADLTQKKILLKI